LPFKRWPGYIKQKGAKMKYSFSLGIVGLILGYLVDTFNERRCQNAEIFDNGSGKPVDNSNSQQSSPAQEHSPGGIVNNIEESKE
jgi:hypothetical protein